MFDVVIGCYYGADVCKLVGLISYINSHQHTHTASVCRGKRGWWVLKNMNAKLGEKVREILCEIPADPSLTITVRSNLQLEVVNYLDVTLNRTNAK